MIFSVLFRYFRPAIRATLCVICRALIGHFVRRSTQVAKSKALTPQGPRERIPPPNERNSFIYMHLLEAGGIEPPSRGGSGNASTCVVGLLNLGFASAGRQALAFPSPTFVSPANGQASDAG